MDSGIRHQRTTRNGDEFDVTTGWRRLICRYRRSGVVARIKRAMRRRERPEPMEDER